MILAQKIVNDFIIFLGVKDKWDAARGCVVGAFCGDMMQRLNGGNVLGMSEVLQPGSPVKKGNFIDGQIYDSEIAMALIHALKEVFKHLIRSSVMLVS